MARTALAETPAALSGLLGVDAADNEEAIDSTNGNTVAHNSKVCFVIRNSHATDYATVTPVVQRTVLEDAAALSIENPDAVQIDAGAVVIIGPYSAANFKKADSQFELDWALEAGTIVDADVTVSMITHP